MGGSASIRLGRFAPTPHSSTFFAPKNAFAFSLWGAKNIVNLERYAKCQVLSKILTKKLKRYRIFRGRMSFGILIFIMVLILIFSFLSKKISDSRNESDEVIEKNDENIIEDNLQNEITEQFFSEVKNGKEKYEFLIISNQFDLMFIKSIFQAERIPYHVDFEHISRLIPGMELGGLGNGNKLYILDEDYSHALKLVNEYIETKKLNNKNDDTGKKIIRNLSEVLIRNWKIPSATDIGGIQIIYKNTKNKI